MLILQFDQMRPILPSRPRHQSQRAQVRSSKAEGLRVSGLCLTEPSTMASCFRSESYFRPLSATATRVSNPLVAEHRVMCGHRVIAATSLNSHDAAIRALMLGGLHLGGASMARFVGLDVSQKLTWICVVDDAGRRVWRGQSASDPEQIARLISRHAGDAAGIGIETGPMTPWLVHEFRAGAQCHLPRCQTRECRPQDAD
jgi:hypothetical protein